jgi:hypothetical protein
VDAKTVPVHSCVAGGNSWHGSPPKDACVAKAAHPTDIRPTASLVNTRLGPKPAQLSLNNKLYSYGCTNMAGYHNTLSFQDRVYSHACPQHGSPDKPGSWRHPSAHTAATRSAGQVIGANRARATTDDCFCNRRLQGAKVRLPRAFAQCASEQSQN